MTFKYKKLLNIFFLAVILIKLGIVFLNKNQAIYPKVGSDHYQYYKTSINIYSLNVHSYNEKKIKKSHYRDPLYPFLISQTYRLFNIERENILKCKFPKNQNLNICKKTLEAIGLFNAYIYLFLFLTTILITRFFFKNYFGIFSFFILVNPLFLKHTNLVFTELISTLLFLLYSFCLWFGTLSLNNSKIHYLASSLIFAFLLLVKSVYFYLFYIYALIIIIVTICFFIKKLNVLNSFSFHFNLKFLFIHSIIALILISPWKIRNVINFGDYKISDRASGVLSLRAEVFTITNEEFKAGFIYWLPDGSLRDKLLKKFDKKILIRFDENNEDSWWKKMDKLDGYILSKLKVSETQTSKKIEAKSKEEFMKNLLLNIKLSFLFFYKSFFIKLDAPLLYKFFIWLIPLGFTLIFINNSLRGNFTLLFFSLPSIFHFSVYSFFTYYEARYNLVVYPVLIIYLLQNFKKISYENFNSRQ